MMLSEELNEWGLPVVSQVKKKTVEPKAPEEKITVLEDVALTLQYLSEVTEPKKIEILSFDDEQDPGELRVRIRINAGDLTPLVKAAQEISDREGDEDLELILDELLDVRKIEKDLDKGVWDEIRHLGSFTGSSVEVVSHPVRPEDFKEAKFEIEIKIGFERPDMEQSLEGLILKVLKQNMQWWV